MATDTPPEVSTENDVHDVETQDEEVGESTSRGMPGTSRKSATKWILGMLVVVGVICAIAIPLALNGNDDDDKKEVTKNNVSANDSPGNSSSPSNSSSPTTSIMTYQSEVGPFNSSIELMSPNVLAGYTTDEDLMEAIKNAAVFSIGSYYNQTLNSFGDGAPDTGTTASDKMNQETNMVSDVAGGDSSKQTTTTSFGTNNQEQGIEEGDLIVSDGQYGKRC